MKEVADLFYSKPMAARIALIAVLALVLVAFGYFLEHSVPALEPWIASRGAWAPLFFVLSFALLTPLFFPVDALCFAAGVLFGFWRGLLWATLGTFMAAALMFFVGRYLAREKVQALVQNNAKFAALQAVLGEDPLKLMFLLRLLPLPFALLSYALSITRVKFGHYLAATSGILVYHSAVIYLAYIATHLTRSIAQDSGQSFLHWMGLAGSIALAVMILISIVRTAREAINRLKPVDD